TGDPNRHEPGIGAEQYGVYYSAHGDPGTWTQALPPWTTAGFVNAIRIGPGPNPRVYVATSQGVFAGTWDGSALSLSLLDDMKSGCSDVVADFSGSAPIVYAAVNFGTSVHGRGVWRCEDSSTGSWEVLHNSAVSDPMWTRLTLTPGPSPVLY